MARKEAAIKKYRLLLPEELSKRYGGAGPYTEAQVTRTVNDLGLNKNFIQYAFLMYCEQEVLAAQGIDEEVTSSMLKVIEKVADGGSFVSAPFDALCGGSDGDGGGFCDGGGGGGDGG